MFSCTPVRYISKPIKQSPCIDSDNSTKKIVIAKAKKVKITNCNSELCFDGLLTDMIENTPIEIIKIVDFNNKVDSVILMELKSRYNIDGLLLLININVCETRIDEVIEGFSHPCVGCKKNIYVNIDFEISIISEWEYFDFNTGVTYGLYVDNYREVELRYRLERIEFFYKDAFLIKDELLFENGLLSSKKIMCL